MVRLVVAVVDDLRLPKVVVQMPTDLVRLWMPPAVCLGCDFDFTEIEIMNAKNTRLCASSINEGAENPKPAFGGAQSIFSGMKPYPYWMPF